MNTTNKTVLSYDKIISKDLENEEKIYYGIIYGNEKIVFIKVGIDGNIKGYKNKYLKIAHRLHKKMGATIICASNPETEVEHLVLDKEMIYSIVSENNLLEWEVYFLGVSDGAYQNLVMAKDIPQTARILGISTSRKSLEDFKEKLYALKDVKKTLVYGTNDYECDILPTLKELECDNLKVITVSGANHEFEGMLDEFIMLSDLL